MKDWISAFRLRTLPLALASIGMGSFLAASNGHFKWSVFLLCALTTILLQILSNLANDYGDTVHGADSDNRLGPQRAVQSGAISLTAMKKALYICSFLAFTSGITLLLVAFDNLGSIFWVFIGLGLLAIAAAITYTAGYRPYGYAGLGDISVLIFFGAVAVLGSYYLYAQSLSIDLILPAMSMGLLSVGVLNVNNIRDIPSDLLAGKKSIPVRIGRANAVRYHYLLLISAIVCSIVYVLLNYSNPTQFIFLVTLPLLWTNAKAVSLRVQAEALDPYLKQLAMSTLAFVLLFGIGQLI